MTLTTQRSDAMSGSLLAFSLIFGAPAFADKTPEPWAQTAILQLSDGDVIGPVRFSPDGNRAVATVRGAGGAYSARIWSTETGLELVALDNPFGDLIEYQFTPTTGDQIFAHTATNLRAWIADDGSVSSDFTFEGEHATNDVAFFNGHFMATKQMGGVEFWSPAGTMVARDGLDPLRPYQEITVTQSGMVYLESAAFTLHLDLSSYDPGEDDLSEVDGSFGPYEMFLASTKSGDLIATYPEVADSGLWVAPVPTVRIRDDVPSVTPTTPVLTEITGFDGEITIAEFSVDDAVLLTRSDTGVVSFWNVSDGSLIAATSDPADPFTGAVMTSSGKALLSHSSGVSRLFDPGLNLVIQEMPAPAADIAMSADGQKMIIYSIGQSSPRVWHRTSP